MILVKGGLNTGKRQLTGETIGPINHFLLIRKCHRHPTIRLWLAPFSSLTIRILSRLLIRLLFETPQDILIGMGPETLALTPTACYLNEEWDRNHNLGEITLGRNSGINAERDG